MDNGQKNPYRQERNKSVENLCGYLDAMGTPVRNLMHDQECYHSISLSILGDEH